MKKSFIRRYFLNKYGIIALIVVIVVAGFLLLRGGSQKSSFESAEVTIGDVVEKVGVNGKISPVSKADLAFEKSGVLAKVNVKIGDRVKKGDLIASLQNAGDKAALASARAKLDDLARGLNSQELGAEQAKIKSATITLTNAQRAALNAARTAYVQAQTAVNNYADTFFDNPQSANPEINVRTQSSSEKTAINYSRLTTTEAMKSWKGAIDRNNSLDKSSDLILEVTAYENRIKNFMSDLSVVINNLNPGNSGLTQAVIDTHVSNLNLGLTSLNQAISSISEAETTLKNAISVYDQANSDFQLKSNRSSSQTIAAQAATVDTYKAELAKTEIVAPIDGLVTLVEPSVGEFVTMGQTVFSVISDGNYKIEAYVPEADIAKIALSNIASTTLDAYGSNLDFPAMVINFDPAETVLEGVPTYKVTLQFIRADEKIRSGMTANLEIITNRRSNVLMVPTRAIIETNGQKTVRVVGTDQRSYAPVVVQIGLKGYEGMTEIVSGVTAGQKVVTYTPK